jgi:hypothetical protein
VNTLKTLLLALLAISCSSAAAAQERVPTVDTFNQANATTKRRVLNDIAASKSQLSIDLVIALVRSGLIDRSADVRVSALAAVTGRAVASRWAGTSGPAMGPNRSGTPSPQRATIPSEWANDQRRLRESVYADCLRVLRSDSDRRARHYALLALGNLELPIRASDPVRQEFVELLVGLYRSDADSAIRSEVVKTFRLIPNTSPDIRDVLRDALLNPDPAIRHEGLAAITPQVVGGSPKLSFEDARPALLDALRDPRSGVRVGAVQALNVFGAAARVYIPMLEQIRQSDPDEAVRESARLAIEAIRRAIQEPA